MRRQILHAVLALWVAACGSDHVTLRGTVDEDIEGKGVSAWVVGGPTAASLVDGAFEIPGIEPGPMDLIFAHERGEIARTEIRDLPAGATLSLERIRWHKGRAFPTAVRVDGAEVVSINGIRMADSSALPRHVESIGVLLAANRDADALLIRPHEKRLPDLRVVITPSTQIVTPAGDPASVRRLSPADPVQVEGRSEEGFVIATRIILPAKAAAKRSGSTEDGPASVAAASDPSDDDGQRGPIGRALKAVTERWGGGETKGSGRNKEEPSKVSDRRDRKGDGGRDDIPPGHRPPPGECRDWIAGLPPGQQPPPYKC